MLPKDTSATKWKSESEETKLEKGKSSFLTKEKALLTLILKKVYVFSSLETMFQVFMGMRQTSLLYGPEGKPLYDIK